MIRITRHDIHIKACTAACVFASLALSGPAMADVMVLTRDHALSGRQVHLNAERMLEIRQSGESQADQASRNVPLDECLLIRFDPLPRQSPPRTWILLSDGRRLSGHGLTLGPETLTLKTGTSPLDAATAVSFPLDDIIGLLLHAPRPEVISWPETDTRVIRANGDVMDVPFAELTDAGVIVDIDPSVDPILLPLGQVRAVLWPPPQTVEPDAGDPHEVMIVLRTGEHIAGRLEALTPERVLLEVDDRRQAWPAGELDAIRLGRIRQIPVEIGMVTPRTADTRNASLPSDDRPAFRMNRDGLGGPLRLGGRIYTHGIGLRGQTAVEITVPEGALWFTAAVGADADAGDFARLNFSIQADDQVVEDLTQLAPGRPARRVAVNVIARKSLTLQLTPDHGSDVGCLGDIADATFIVE